jgi:hypothetical protein
MDSAPHAAQDATRRSLNPQDLESQLGALHAEQDLWRGKSEKPAGHERQLEAHSVSSEVLQGGTRQVGAATGRRWGAFLVDNLQSSGWGTGNEA